MHATSFSDQFIERYGESTETIYQFFAPGRVNLIGDHIDYVGGFVFPCAINFGTTLLIRVTQQDTISLASSSFDVVASLNGSEANQKYPDQWINYPLGVLQQFKSLGNTINGIECLYVGNLPNGAGLSSSASIEVVTAFALNTLFNCRLDRVQIAQLCQRAEREFVGVQCGIMDQFAVAIGQQDHVMKLDCNTLQYEQVPLNLNDHSVLLINTNQRRELSDSKYNERVSETTKALSVLQSVLPVSQLTEVTPLQLDEHKALFSDLPIHYQRTKHVVSEQARVLQAVHYLKAGDISAFGRLMFESHDSLHLNYEVSSEPLNLLVDLARESEHVSGARLTGAGFGGCTVNLVQSDKIEQFKSSIESVYPAKTGLTPTFLEITPSQGVHQQALNTPAVTNEGAQ